LNDLGITENNDNDRFFLKNKRNRKYFSMSIDSLGISNNIDPFNLNIPFNTLNNDTPLNLDNPFNSLDSYNSFTSFNSNNNDNNNDNDNNDDDNNDNNNNNLSKFLSGKSSVTAVNVNKAVSHRSFSSSCRNDTDSGFLSEISNDSKIAPVKKNRFRDVGFIKKRLFIYFFFFMYMYVYF
jgi:hypothetical protein